MTKPNYIRWFNELSSADTPLVGGKTASLGELCSLRGEGVEVPAGFAITAEAYRDALTAAGAWGPLRGLLDGIDKPTWSSSRFGRRPPASLSIGPRTRTGCAGRSSPPTVS